MERSIGTFKIGNEIFERIGDLEWFEGALISLFEEKTSGDLFLLHWVDVQEGFHRWLLYPVSHRALQLYLEGKLTNEDLLWLNNPATVRIVNMNGDMKLNKVESKKVAELSKEYLPTAESFFEAELCLNLPKIQHFLEKSAAQKKIHVYPHTPELSSQVADSDTNVAQYTKKSTKLIDIEGIGPSYATILQDKLGISSVEELLELGASKKGRQEIAVKTGISEAHILRWVNMADLFRIKGIEAEFSDLLEKAGVNTMKELRTRNAASLHARLIEINAQDNYAGRAPHLNEVESWIEQAGQLEPKVTHS